MQPCVPGPEQGVGQGGCKQGPCKQGDSGFGGRAWLLAVPSPGPKGLCPTATPDAQTASPHPPCPRSCWWRVGILGSAGTPRAAWSGGRSPSCGRAPCRWRWRACGAAWCWGPGAERSAGAAPGRARTEAPAPRPGSAQEASGHMRGACSGAARGLLAGPGGRKTSSKCLPCPGPPGGVPASCRGACHQCC